MTQQPDWKAELAAITARLDSNQSINVANYDLRRLLDREEALTNEVQRQREEITYAGGLANRHAKESNEFLNKWRQAERQRAEDLQKAETAYLAQAAELALRDQRISELRQEAQTHAQEARTANATINEIYQVVSGATGEVGNWHGAEPVRQRINELESELTAARRANEEVWDKAMAVVSDFDSWVMCTCSECKADSHAHAVKIEASLGKIFAALEAAHAHLEDA